jgi:hypothetical protein
MTGLERKETQVPGPLTESWWDNMLAGQAVSTRQCMDVP